MELPPVVFALLKAYGCAAALLLLRGLIWLVNLLVVAPVFDPLNKLPGESGQFFQSHLDDVAEYVEFPFHSK
jgi:hypothetical protein